MLEKAREQSWDDVSALEAERRKLIELFFLEPIPQSHTEMVAAGIQSIMAINRDISVLVELNKHDAEQALQKMEQGKKAIKAYSG